MAEKVTVMVLKVNDLQCPCCYKKVKRVLCKFPQIRDQIYDEKGNTVTITVVCCSPEKIRDQICRKGCGVIKSIAIKEPKKPDEPQKPKPPKKPKVVIVEEPKPAKPKVVIFEEPKPKLPAKPPPVVVVQKPKETEKPDPPKAPEPIPVPNPPPPVIPRPVPVDSCPPSIPARTCCRQCYEGNGGGPCYYGYGVPPPPPPCYDGYYYGYGRGCNISRCDYYFSEDNPQSCRIM